MRTLRTELFQPALPACSAASPIRSRELECHLFPSRSALSGSLWNLARNMSPLFHIFRWLFNAGACGDVELDLEHSRLVDGEDARRRLARSNRPSEGLLSDHLRQVRRSEIISRFSLRRNRVKAIKSRVGIRRFHMIVFLTSCASLQRLLLTD